MAEKMEGLHIVGNEGGKAGNGPAGSPTYKDRSNSYNLIMGTAASPGLGNQEIIQRVTAESLISTLQGQYQMDEDIEFQGRAAEIGFGVELEVFYDDCDNLNLSVEDANAKGLTDAHRPPPEENVEDSDALLLNMPEDYVNGDSTKWSVVEDASLVANGFMIGLEWVSPILKVAKASWDAIKKVCGCITRFTGKISDACAEHIHVGHKELEGDDGKFNNLFKMYQAFEDVIECYARSGWRAMRIRADRHASKMQMEAPNMAPFKHAACMEHYSFHGLEVVLEFVSLLSAGKEIDERKPAYDEFLDRFFSENENLRALERDWLDRKILTGQEQILEAGSCCREEMADNPEFPGTIRRMQEMAEKYAIMTSYINRFGGNPFEYGGRKRAVNVHQNFTDGKRKPTVEFRRFNGTVSPEVVQANALLSTCLVKTATEKSSEEIDAAIEAADRMNSEQRAAAFVDLITEDDHIKKVLLEAYMANLDESQATAFREAFQDESPEEEEAI